MNEPLVERAERRKALAPQDRSRRVCQIYEGTSDVQKIIIQRALA